MSASRKFRRILVGTVALGCLLGAGRHAHATLGGDIASVEADQDRLRAVRQITKLPFGERHDLLLPSGVVVREYVSPGGTVFAITWHGPRMPDLRGLLGASFEQWVESDTRVRQGPHRTTMTGPDLVVRSGGHRGSFAGRAWVPSLVPPGVDPDTMLDGRVVR
jgi:Protein of unknown function (DUF2844)